MDDVAGSLFEPVAREGLLYCVDIEPIPRLMVRVDVDGRLLIKGRRNEIEALVVALRSLGVVATLEYCSFCG